jgi:cytochrome c oxidase subunit 2
MGTARVAQSVLDAAGPQALQLRHLWWILFWVCAAVFVVVLAFVAQAIRRPPDRPTPERRLAQSVGVATFLTVAILFGFLIITFWTGRAVASTQDKGAITYNVTGFQWWWQVEYIDPNDPSIRFRTANEIHIPVGRPVVFNLTSRDVIHSFWVPNLHGKKDLIPGYVTSIWMQADRPGVFRGQCAEFCGLQHARMSFYVTADDDARFKGWLATQRQPAAEPSDDTARQGQQVFMRSTCTMCHTIRGTSAGGALGPELTHVGSRGTLGAGTMPNALDHIQQWVRDPQRPKPGTRMPPIEISDQDIRALATYLESLK